MGLPLIKRKQIIFPDNSLIKILHQTYVSGSDSYDVDNVSLAALNKARKVLLLNFNNDISPSFEKF